MSSVSPPPQRAPSISMAFVVVVMFASTLVSCVRASASPCQTAGLYEDWLSEPDVFLHADQPKGFQGLHVACIWEDANELRLEIFKNALNESPMMRTLPLQTADWQGFRKSLKQAMGIKKKTNDWTHLELKQPFGVFGANGTVLKSVDDALTKQLIFVIEGGQWFWPPVREGFVRLLGTSGTELLTLSVAPVLFKVRGFLKEKECEEIINIGENRMEESPVSLMDKDKEKGAKEFRTSTQARVSWAESDTLRQIDSRVARLTKVPKAHNEEVQILRYKETQYYSAHLDNWDPAFYSDSAWFEYGHNNRFITVFWYLTDVEKGGETLFPRANGLPQPSDMWSCERGLKVKPEKGAVIFWYSLHPNGNTDPNGLHGACPVEEGQKWSANYWVWNKPRSATRANQNDDDQEEEEEETDSGKKNKQPKKDLLPKHFAVGAVVMALLFKRFGVAKRAKESGTGRGEGTGTRTATAEKGGSTKKSRKEKKRQ